MENLRNLQKIIMTWGKLFSITWHNLYNNEKLALCRLKAVKGYLLSDLSFLFRVTLVRVVLLPRYDVVLMGVELINGAGLGFF